MTSLHNRFRYWSIEHWKMLPIMETGNNNIMQPCPFT